MQQDVFRHTIKCRYMCFLLCCFIVLQFYFVKNIGQLLLLCKCFINKFGLIGLVTCV